MLGLTQSTRDKKDRARNGKVDKEAIHEMNAVEERDDERRERGTNGNCQRETKKGPKKRSRARPLRS